MENEEVYLKYLGPNVAEGMDPFLLSKVINDLAKLTELTIKCQAGPNIQFQIRLRRIKRGSYDIQQVIEYAKSAKDLLEVVSPFIGVYDLVTQCIEMTRHLSGHPPQKKEFTTDGNVQITNHKGQVQIYNIHADNLTLNLGGSNFAHTIANTPQKDWATSLEVRNGLNDAYTIDHVEAEKVRPVNSADNTLEHIYRTWLTVVKPVLKGKGKWTFSDGVRSITADITDQDFLELVQDGKKAFTSGDSLLVEMKSLQERIKGKLKASFTVVKVLEHQHPA